MFDGSLPLCDSFNETLFMQADGSGALLPTSENGCMHRHHLHKGQEHKIGNEQMVRGHALFPDVGLQTVDGNVDLCSQIHASLPRATFWIEVLVKDSLLHIIVRSVACVIPHAATPQSKHLGILQRLPVIKTRSSVASFEPVCEHSSKCVGKQCCRRSC